MITTGSWLREMLAFPMLEATKWRLQPLLAAINLKPPALPGDTYSTLSMTLLLFVQLGENWLDDPERYRAMGLEFPKK